MPLRLITAGESHGPGLTCIVEGLPVCCTHFDAFRFFTPAAQPLNRVQPSRATAPEHEQRGCLHANMDLYKWAFKLAPFAPSELIADGFALTGFFLARHVLEPRGLSLAEARASFIAALRRDSRPAIAVG